MAYRSRKLVGGVALAAVVGLLLSACSTGSPDSGASSGGEDGGSAVPAAVVENVNKYKGLPTFTPPGDPVDISKVRGKHMFVIPLVPNPFNESIQNTMRDIAQKVGMKFTLYPNQGQASQWVQGMNQAITAKPDIIVLSTAPDPRVLQPQLAAAKRAGIPVVVTHFYDDSSPNPPDCEG